MSTDDVIEQAARVLAGLEPGEEWPTNESLAGGLTGTRDDEYRQAWLDEAWSLDNAGMLARPLPTRDEIEQAVNDRADFLDWETCREIADAVLELLTGQDR